MIDYVQTYNIGFRIEDVDGVLLERSTLSEEYSYLTKRVRTVPFNAVNTDMDLPEGDILVVKTTGSILVRFDADPLRIVPVTNYAIIPYSFSSVDVTQINVDGAALIEFVVIKKAA